MKSADNSPYASFSGDFLNSYGTEENRHTIEEGNSTIQIVPKNRHKCLSFKIDPSCLKVAALVLNSGLFITAAGLSINESLRAKPNIAHLAIYDSLIGLTSYAYCIDIFASDAEFEFPVPKCLGYGKETLKLTGKEINRFLCAWSYASVFIGTQGLDNIPQHRYYTLLFIYALGWLKSKDIHSLLSLEHSNYELSSPLESSEEPIRTLGFSTRDYSRRAKAWLGATVVGSIGLTALNFAFVPAWGESFPPALREYGKIGLYQTAIGVYTGSVIGDLAARGFELVLKQKEQKCATNLIESQPSKLLHAMRVGKTLFALFSPLMVNTLLAIRTQPNTVSDYCVKLSVGGIYGGNLLIARAEFEKKSSFMHRVSFAIYDEGIPCTEKAKAVAKKYFPSIAFFGLLTIYFSVVAAFDSARDDYALLTFFVTMFASFVLTDLVALGRERFKEDNCVFNEGVFRLLYGSVPLCIYYMLLSHLIKIGNRHLNHDSPALYGLQLAEWGALGINMGNDRAVYAQSEVPGMLPITSPIAMTELTKSFVDYVLSYANF
ncbi:MAG: hypothetical protein H0V82_10215 [Candidatus Protochlamydia sp.]|nr:hypothetical protein [Candidatus Protochlamydia sp.]